VAPLFDDVQIQPDAANHQADLAPCELDTLLKIFPNSSRTGVLFALQGYAVVGH
jgi:hypothetical protein